MILAIETRILLWIPRNCIFVSHPLLDRLKLLRLLYSLKVVYQNFLEDLTDTKDPIRTPCQFPVLIYRVTNPSFHLYNAKSLNRFKSLSRSILFLSGSWGFKLEDEFIFHVTVYHCLSLRFRGRN